MELTEELSSQSVLDVGRGTGTFACTLAARGKEVTASDPARASLAVARRQPHADKVRWVEAAATEPPPGRVELVTLTGNVAQVFPTDDEWAQVLRAAREALVPGGYLVSFDPTYQTHPLDHFAPLVRRRITGP